MPEVIVDKESVEILKEFYATYKEELERESTERSKQAIIDSKQAEILAKEKVEAEKELKLMAEESAKEKKELLEFRKSVTDTLLKMGSVENPTQKDYQALNANVEKLIEYEKRNDSANVNGQFLNTALVMGLALFLSVFVLFKTAKPLVDRISQMLFRI